MKEKAEEFREQGAEISSRCESVRSITAVAGAAGAGWEAPDERELHLAAAVLLFEVAKADHQLGPVELQRLQQVLREHWGRDDEALSELLEVAGRASDDSVSLHRQLDLLNERLDPAEKFRLMTGLWRLPAPTARSITTRSTCCGAWRTCCMSLTANSSVPSTWRWRILNRFPTQKGIFVTTKSTKVTKVPWTGSQNSSSTALRDLCVLCGQ